MANSEAGNELIPTRRSLLSRLRNWGDNESWTDFFETYWKLIYATALKAGLTESEAEEVVQETVICVSKQIPDFIYDASKGSFKGWLLRLTSWRIADQWRKRGRHMNYSPSPPLTSTRTDGFERSSGKAMPELEAIWDREWEKNILETAMERVKRKVDAKQYQAFDLYAVRNWSASRVARALKMNIGRVYLAKHRVNLLIKKEIQLLEAKNF